MDNQEYLAHLDNQEITLPVLLVLQELQVPLGLQAKLAL